MNTGAFGEGFPYTNFHDLNLDWIIKIVKDFLSQYTHLQEVISNGEIQLTDTISSGLADINDTAEQIQNTLNQWYEEHNEELAEQLASDLETMQVRFGNLMTTIPADFSALVAEVNTLANSLSYARPINLLTTTPVEGYYISYETGALGTNAEWAYYPEFEVEAGKYYYGSFNGAHVAFFDYNHDFISGVLINHVPTNADFVAPATAMYATYSYKMSAGDQYFIRSIEAPLEYIDPAFRTLESVVSANLINLTDILSTGKNLFNKYNVIDGYSIDYGNANRLWRNSDYCYCPDYIPVKPNTTYHHNRGVIIGIYDNKCNLLQTINHTVVADDTFTTGATASFIKIGTTQNVKEILQVEEGSVGTGYKNFEIRFKHSSEQATGSESIITVKPVGGDYSSISDAISHSNDGDIILVFPSTYSESVKAYGKNVHIVGLDRSTCILTHGGLDYSNPPMEMSCGSVSNMTIIATNSGGQGDYPAYCVHIDDNHSEDNGLTFTNVHFINEVHQCVGIGLRPHFELAFDNCIFEADNQACLYCHDWETDSTGDKSGQHLAVRNCTLVNNSSVSATIMLQSQELETDVANVLFLGNSVLNKNISGAIISMTRWSGRTLTNNSYLGSSDWVLNINSALNTNNIMNNIKIMQPNDIITETLQISNSEAISSDTVKSFSISTVKQGYTAIGITAVTGSGTSGLLLQEFFIESDTAKIYFRNVTSNSITPSRIDVTVLYKAT